MKKTLTINLGGTVYHIDEDAYHLLDNYLTNLRIHFCREEGAEEIVHDIELRISELFTDRLNEGKQVITIEDVEEIIARMGKPEDLSDEESGEASGSEKQKGTTMRRLFRDPDNKVLGGVASGLAAYMGWDVTWVRIILLVLGYNGHGLPTSKMTHQHVYQSYNRNTDNQNTCYGHSDSQPRRATHRSPINRRQHLIKHSRQCSNQSRSRHQQCKKDNQ
jgi:hypothetical protein